MAKFDRNDLPWLAGLALLVVIFFAPFIFFGRVPINADWLNANFEPGKSHIGGAAHNSELDDPIYQFYPLRMEAVRQWKAGRTPLWNRRIMCGTPLLADGISKPFDPFIVFYLVFGGPAGRGLELVCHFLLMTTGAYVLARSFGISRPGAALSGVVFAFNGLAVTWMELRTATGAFAFFPWLFMFVDAAMREKRFAYAAAAGIAGGCMVLGGHPQFVMYGFALAGLYAAWQCCGTLAGEGVREAAKAACLAVAALGLGLAVAAVEILPFAELVGQSARSSTQYVRANRAATPLTFLPYLFPNFFGAPVGGGYVGAWVFRRPYMTAVGGYVGLSALVAALAGLFVGKVRRKGFFVFVVLSTFVVILLTGFGVTEALPVVGRFFTGLDVARMVFASNFALAILAGAGAGALGEADWKDRWMKVLCGVLGVVLLVLVAAVVFLPRSPGVLRFWDETQAVRFAAFLERSGAGGGSGFAAKAVFVPLVFFGVAAALVLLSPDVKRAAGAVLAVVVALELFVFGLHYNPYVPASEIAPDYAFLKALPESGRAERVVGIDTPGGGALVGIKGDFLIPNTLLLYGGDGGIEDIRGDESLRLERYVEYIRRVVPKETSLLANIHLPVYDSPFIDALNVRYVMSAFPIEAEHLSEVYSDGKAFVYENTRALPRAFLVGKLHCAMTLLGELNVMHESADFDFLREAVIGCDIKLGPGAAFEELEIAEAEITEASETLVRVETHSDKQATLVLSESCYPGWTAEVDGARASIIPTNCVMRGVFVSAGRHVVTFRYEPLSFARGAKLSILALAVCVLALAGAAIRPHKGDTPPAE